MSGTVNAGCPILSLFLAKGWETTNHNQLPQR
jgi:hypothetical protein